MKKVDVKHRYYEPIPGETAKAWAAFCVYRDMGNGRSLDKAYRSMTGKKSGRHARHWATWSKKNHWVTRSRAFDEYMFKQMRKTVEEVRKARYAAMMSKYL